MDNYFDKKRFNNYYIMLAQQEAVNLQSYARRISSHYIKNLVPHLNFNNEIDDFIRTQLQQIKIAKDEHECKKCLFNLREQKRLINQQDMLLRTGGAKIIASANIVKKMDSWGYVINGVSIVLGSGQVIAGAGIFIASLSHGNFVGMGAGLILTLHGANSIEEGIKNIYSGMNDNTGFLKERYITTAEFMGFDARTAAIAYGVADLALSTYGLSRMVLKPDAWCLFRYIPSDFVRSIKTTSAPALLIEGVGDGFSIKSTYDSYKN